MDEVERLKEIQFRAMQNLAEFLEHGHGLRITTKSWVIAKGDGKVLLGGLGGRGDGVMWFDDDGRRDSDPTYEAAPYEPDRVDHLGHNGR